MAKPLPSWWPEHNPADIEALGALAYEQDSFGPTLEDVRKGLIGKIGENMSFRRFKRFSGSNETGCLPARFAHRCGRRVRR